LSDLFCILLRHFLGFCTSISFASTHDDDYDPRPTTKNMVSNRTDDIYGMESRSAYDDDDEDVGMGTGMGMGMVEGGEERRTCGQAGWLLLLFIDNL
jgi:hypothetical protein